MASEIRQFLIYLPFQLKYLGFFVRKYLQIVQ